MNLFLIILLGTLLRLSYIVKPEGLWNDEYVSWSIATTNFQDGFWHEILSQCHMPLYYLYLKCFEDSELLLRLSSVVPSIAAIFVMFKAGETKDKTTAYILALMTSISSFLIYYSQEVRFYSLLFLFSAISLLFMLKYIIHYRKKDLVGYIISSFLILFTHTIGFVYVFFTLLYILYKSNKKKIILTLGCIAIISALPLVYYIFTHVGTSQWWGSFSYRNIIFMLTDFFSPVLTNNVNIPSYIIYNKDPFFITKLFIPSLLVIGVIISALIKQRKLLNLFYITLATTIVLAITAVSGKFVFITKYNIEILPILLYIFSVGITNCKKVLMYIILSVLVLFQLGNFLFPDYVTKLPRKEGNRIPIALLQKHKLSPNDKIIFTYYNADRFSKYIDLKLYNYISIDKANTTKIITDSNKLTPEEYIYNREHIHRYLNGVINKRQRTFVIFLDSVAFFSDEILQKYISSSDTLIDIHPMYIESSVLKNEFIEYGKNNQLKVKFSRMGNWTLLILEEKD